MSRKRNEFLDISDEEEDVARQSEEEETRDDRLSRLKRRKLDYSDEVEEEEEEGVEHSDHDQYYTAEDGEEAEVETDIQSGQAVHSPRQTSKLPVSTIKSLSPTQLAAAQRKARKTGIIYLSRIPPFMKPQTLRQLLTPWGEIGRIFLTPEPQASYLKRKKAGGNRKRSFVDGWVEFMSKKDAKICAETLNGNIIGGKKKGFYHDDIWNMKYLRGFKWSDLMEQVQNEDRMREARLRAEIQRETRERKTFLSNVERSKMEKTMEAKKKYKHAAGDTGGGQTGARLTDKAMEVEPSTLMPGKGRRNSERTFRQNKVRIPQPKTSTGEHSQDVQRLLNKIF